MGNYDDGLVMRLTIEEIDDVEYYADMQEYFERQYDVSCVTCWKLDRLSQPRFESLGWKSDRAKDFCPAHVETQFDATNGRDLEYERWAAKADETIPF